MTSNYELKTISYELNNKINEAFKLHPFSEIPTNCDYKCIMADYLAMSQAFPYLQAGSQKDVFWDFMENNKDIPEHVELTTVVGNFLCWDETGGLYPTMAMKLKALPKILETNRFHSNILKRDCYTLFKKEIKPNYTNHTKSYLIKLYNLLSSNCPITRVASMVSFENHANVMISSLWNSISLAFPIIEKHKLTYFNLHVGGADPAEKYHVEMTNNLISKIVTQDNYCFFIEKFLEYYGLHHSWCKSLIDFACV